MSFLPSPLQVTAGVLALGAALGAALPAPADGWRIRGTASQDIGFNSNPDLARDPVRTVLGNSALTLDFSKSSPRSEISIRPTVSATLSDGGESADDLTSLRPALSFNASHRSGDTRFRTGLSARVQPTEFSSLANPEFIGFNEEGEPLFDLDIIDQDALQFSLGLNAGISHNLNSRNDINFGLSSSIIRFDEDDDTLTPSTSVALRTGWDHRLNNSTSGGLSLALRQVRFGGDDPRTDQTFDLNARLSRQETATFRYGGGLGLNLSVDEDDGVTPGLNYAADMTYLATPRDQFSFQAAQVTDPGSDGALQTRTTAGFQYAHGINARESFGTRLNYSRQDDIGGERGGGNSTGNQLITAALSYNIDLTPTVSGTLGYQVRNRFGGDENIMSHNIFFSISTDLEILP